MYTRARSVCGLAHFLRLEVEMRSERNMMPQDHTHKHEYAQPTNLIDTAVPKDVKCWARLSSDWVAGLKKSAPPSSRMSPRTHRAATAHHKGWRGSPGVLPDREIAWVMRDFVVTGATVAGGPDAPVAVLWLMEYTYLLTICAFGRPRSANRVANNASFAWVSISSSVGRQI